ncbi:MAG: FISUMP domain-containing protein [Bacteroidota bacterium]
MVKIYTLSLLILSSAILYGQRLNITFSPAGASPTVDSVRATNLRTNEHVTLPGNDTLFLFYSSGINNVPGLSRQGTVFPNPFAGRTTFVADIQKAQTVSLEVFNLAGRSVAHSQVVVQPGVQSFSISLSKTGVYVVSMITDTEKASFKIICTGSAETGDGIDYTGTATDNGKFVSLKETDIYSLGYAAGDIILYRCRGGVHTTIITDSPTDSKNYTVTFASCADPDGKNYAIVKVGTQTWMAENLAWLPAVSDSSKGSDSLPYFYVYDYEGSSVAEAKNTANYKRFGVLYNWIATMIPGSSNKGMQGKSLSVCPAGWHLPHDEDWKILETTLGMTEHDADSIYLRNSGNVGSKLKSTLAWPEDGNGSNFSGFTALAGGYRNTHGSFNRLGTYALFWTATESDTLSWYRSLYSGDSGVFRLKTLRSHGFSVRCLKDSY